MRGGYVVAAVALVVGLLAGAGLIVLATTSSIEAAGPTACPDDSVRGRFSDDDPRQVCTVANTDVRNVVFGVTVTNPGRIGVDVTEVPLVPLDVLGFTPQAVVEGVPPFRLEPGEVRTVLVAGTLPSCEQRTTGGATTFGELLVRFRVLGINRDQRVRLEPAVRFFNEPCP